MTHSFLESTIEEVCNVEYGTRVVRKRDAGTIYPVYGGGGETFFLNTFNRENRVVVARFAMSEKCTRRVIGKFALNDSGLTLSSRNLSKLRQDYLDYFILSINDQIYESARGTAQKNLDVPAFRQMKIIYPASLERQHEIVQKLDSAFAEIDLLEENLEQSDQKSKQLLQSILSGSFENSGVKHEFGGTLSDQRQAWPSVALKDFCKMYQPSTISTKEMIPTGKYVVYGANGPIGRYNKFNHEEPQLLVTCRGATCGAVNMSEPFAWINGNAMVIQPNLDVATLDYMKYAFLGGIDVSSSITGSAQPQITRTTLEVLKVPLPTLDRQIEIVEKLDFVFTEIEVLRSRLKLKKDLVGALRKSLLSGAFNPKKEVA